MPRWLVLVGRWGVLVDSADRTYAPFSFGLAAKLGRPYASLEIGGLIHPDEMTDAVQTVWDVRAMAMRGRLFDGNAWMFSIGRDFARVESTVKRSFL